MAYNYIVTAQPATSVITSISANFTGPNDVNLIAAKGLRVEVSLVTSEGLKPVLNLPINGRVCSVLAFRPKNEDKDSLFLLTERLKCMIFSFDIEQKEVVTRGTGDLYQHIGRQCDTGFIAIVDPTSQTIALRLYTGLLKIIPLANLYSSSSITAFDVRVDHMNVIDLAFLEGHDTPTVAYIHEDDFGNRHLYSATIDVEEKELKQSAISCSNIEVETQMLIPVPAPLQGVLLVGQETIQYISTRQAPVSLAPPELQSSVMQCFCCLDSKRVLLGDTSGKLMILLLLPGDDGVTVDKLQLETLGKTTSPRTLAYLDNGVVFAGSSYGDSQLVRLLTEPDENGSLVEILETINGIGPINDMLVVDQDRQGQGSVLTCSGFGHTGSLRIVRSGIGIQDVATADLVAMVTGVWTINTGVETDLHTEIVVGFIERSRVISFCGDGEDLEELQQEQQDFVQDEQTIYCANVAHGYVIQVVPSKILLIHAATRRLAHTWTPPPGGPLIDLATSNKEQVVVACKEHLIYLTVNGDGLRQEGEKKLENEVSCLDISVTGSGPRTDILAVCLWKDISVLLVRLPSMEVATTEKLGGVLVSRSVVKCVFEGQDYLFVSMGDGAVVYFPAEFYTGRLGVRKRVVLGTVPSYLRAFQTGSSFNLFVCSDRPSVIYSSNQKLLFANVNVKAVDFACPLNSKAYKESLIVVSKSVMTFGKVDDIQKLHIRTVHLGETPRRIALDPVSGTIGVLLDRQVETQSSHVMNIAQNTSRADSTNVPTSLSSARVATNACSGPRSIDPKLLCTFAVLDMHTFDVLHAHEMAQNEIVCSMCVMNFSNEHAFYCVGTSISGDEEDTEDRLGYIHLFQFKEGKFVRVGKKEVNGAVYSLVNFNGKLLAAINNTVAVYEWSESKELRCECQYSDHVMVLFLKVKGEFILCGDIMRSLTLLQYKVEGTLHMVASDFQTNWMYAIEILDDESCIGSEECGNVFTCSRDSAATSDEELRQLNIVGRYHIADHINVFRQGSLTMKDSEDKFRQQSVLFGTVGGSVGVVITLKKEMFDFLATLQGRLANVIKSIGNIPHSDFRSFVNGSVHEPSTGFIDGDLIEMFLDLPPMKMRDVVAGLTRKEESNVVEVTVDYLTKFVEELTRLH